MSYSQKKFVGIMQPYIFPYIGYFQLAAAVDHFVFYDDVQYIKGGWINRNRITNQGKDVLFTVPAVGRRMNAKIRDVTSGVNAKWVKKFNSSLQCEYSKAPYFADVSEMVLNVFAGDQGEPISELAIRSVEAVFQYLEMPFSGVRASESHPNTDGLRRATRVISIAQSCGATVYVNLPGGAALYQDADFTEHNMELAFILDQSRTYKQFNYEFLPKLSIIDVLMHNSPEVVREMLAEYALVKRDQL